MPNSLFHASPLEPDGVLQKPSPKGSPAFPVLVQGPGQDKRGHRFQLMDTGRLWESQKGSPVWLMAANVPLGPPCLYYAGRAPLRRGRRLGPALLSCEGLPPAVVIGTQ